MEYRELEITMISADGIKDVNVFGKMDVYAMVWMLGYSSSTKKKTNVDTNCGTSPRWNHKMQFTIDEQSLYNPNLFLFVQLKADKSIGEKNIGEVSIPIPELLEGNDGAALKVVEYQIKTTSSGKPKGTLKFSYKFGDRRPGPCDDQSDAKKKKKKEGEPVTAYPAKKKKGKGKRKPKLGGTRPAMGYPFHPMTYPHRGYPGHSPPGYVANYPPPGYGHPPPPGYAYPQPGQPPRINPGMGMALGVGLGAGLISAMVIRDGFL